MSLLIFPAVAFVLAWPFALITLVGKLGQEKRRPAVSLGIGIVAVASGTIATVYAGAPATPLVSGIILLSMVTVSASAVATACFLFGNVAPNGRRLCAAAGSLLQLPFLVAQFVGPDRLPGAAPPVFAEKLPLLGILFDALAAAIGTAGEIGYRGFFSLGLLAGLYLEVFLGAAAVCLVAGIVMGSPGEGATGG
ncbi:MULTISPECIES: hypothetical protein [Methanoculleus]|uniref:Uncharacterized protein n=2 Tax=Methanoculleus TaxID=45989 RepID=A3CRS8_METMJ|nr:MULTISPECIES: hypothetical protein [Methanoculleus]ABN56078.1 hypothetical protein Memar_0143 [Methanoculleus marisnigri JR1]UYU17556.1 hypothetical protein OH143_07500 [Methanoculleus submarinus]